MTHAMCHACALGKCRYVPPTFTPEQEQLIQETIADVYGAFELLPGDGGRADLTKPVIRRLCRRMCRQRAFCGMTEQMIIEAQRHFMIEGTDAFGKLALLP
jgi:hypothetical protein